MSTEPNIMGYFILPHDYSEGFASLSLEELLELYGSELNFPFVNPDRLQRLKCDSGVQKKVINDIDATGFQDKKGWSPTSRFLYQMSENGMYDKLGIPSNRMIITTSRRAIMEIIKFGRSSNVSNLTLKTKLKIGKYGKRMKIAYVNQAKYDYFWSKKESNSLFGLKFGLYITNDDQQNTKTDATLFSIHCLQIDDVCFIYEAEIDAIQYSKVGKGRNGELLIVEIKTDFNKDRIVKAFKKYSECNKKSSSQNQIGSSLNKLDEMFESHKFGIPFCQGELGNVHRFIYGFHDKQNQSDLSLITAEEFDCYPGTFLSRDASYLFDFVELLNDSGILSPNNELAWDDWDSWKLTKDNNSVKLEKDGELIGNLGKWERV